MLSTCLKLGLALISLLVLVLFAPPNLSAARHTASKPVVAKKVSTQKGKILAVPKSAAKAKVTGTAKAKPALKASVASSVKGKSRQVASSPTSSTKGGSPATAKRSSRTGTKAATKAASRRTQKTIYKQQQPEPERIRNIQQALSDHGYPLEVNGVWDAPTVEALKKFQTEQKIENLSGRGKLDSMTLIALGLGPKREPTSGQTEEPKQAPEGKLP